jgi:protein-S-isoprenylcysteine O-methyltransferase Ste14
LCGGIMAVFSFINFGQFVTPNPVPLKNYTLKTSGMYKYIRHPIYSSVLLSLLGFVVYCQSLSGLVFWFIGLLFIGYKTNFEEEQLILKFPEYIDYRKNTKKVIPFIY